MPLHTLLAKLALISVIGATSLLGFYDIAIICIDHLNSLVPESTSTMSDYTTLQNIEAVKHFSLTEPETLIGNIPQFSSIKLRDEDLLYTKKIINFIIDPACLGNIGEVAPKSQNIQAVLSTIREHNLVPQVYGDTLCYTNVKTPFNFSLQTSSHQHQVTSNIYTLFARIISHSHDVTTVRDRFTQTPNDLTAAHAADTVDSIKATTSTPLTTALNLPSDVSTTGADRLVWDNYRGVDPANSSSGSTQYSDLPPVISAHSLNILIDKTNPRYCISLTNISDSEGEISTLIGANHSLSDTALLTKNFSTLSIKSLQNMLI